VDEAIFYVNSKDKPLALYVFSNSNAVIEKVLKNTSSGSALANDVLMQATVSSLPFGGVGASGTGAYHGKHTFDVFSHKKSVMIKSLGLEIANNIRYPPYDDTKLGIITKLTTQSIVRPFPFLKVILVLLVSYILVKNPQNRIFRSIRVLLGIE